MNSPAGCPAVPAQWAVQLTALGTPAALGVCSPMTDELRWSAGHLPDGRAVDADLPLYAASVTKQFTAALTATAVLEGSLSYCTPVRTVLPQLPGWADAVQVHHLLHHTAGLPSTSVVTSLLGCQEQDLDNDTVLEGLCQVVDPPQPPGRAFAYSNLGYVLLAEVVRCTTGTALRDLAAARLFDPLGLRSARWGGPPPVFLPGVPAPPATTGDGGLWISTSDLLRWLGALNRDDLGTDIGRLLRTPGRLDDGSPLTYAWGATAREHPAGVLFTHGGNWPGWTTKATRQPATGVAVALMTCGADTQAVSDLAIEITHALTRPRVMQSLGGSGSGG